MDENTKIYELMTPYVDSKVDDDEDEFAMYKSVGFGGTDILLKAEHYLNYKQDLSDERKR